MQIHAQESAICWESIILTKMLLKEWKSMIKPKFLLLTKSEIFLSFHRAQVKKIKAISMSGRISLKSILNGSKGKL